MQVFVCMYVRMYVCMHVYVCLIACRSDLSRCIQPGRPNGLVRRAGRRPIRGAGQTCEFSAGTATSGLKCGCAFLDITLCSCAAGRVSLESAWSQDWAEWMSAALQC